jgi:octaprenyl-diphosphate synthase
MRLEEYLKRVQVKISEWIDELQEEYITETFSKIESGKMVRSQLMFYIAKDRAEEVINLSSIIELIHLASLLHDDVIDDAETRRGKPSVFATEGSKVAIMLGDILYSKAFVELSQYEPKIIGYIAGAVTKLSIGEMVDVNLSHHFNSNRELYLQMIYNKTASLIEIACRVSAITTQQDEETFGEYGRGLGIAFQVIDDILDITQTSEQLGKPAMSDFLEGKTTLPYISLYNYLDSDGKNKLISLHKKELNSDDERWLLQKFNESRAIEEAYYFAKEESLKALKLIPEDATELRGIVDKLMQRSS